MERPEQRTFNTDPLAEIMADRGKYIAAAITIVRAFLVAGKPVRPPPLASYGEWSAMVRAPLIWLGCADPVDTQQAARESDPETLSFASIMSELKHLLPLGHSMTTGEIKQAAEEKLTGNYEGGPQYVRTKLRDVLLVEAGHRGEIDSVRLGRKLGKFKGRIVDGVKLSGEYSTDRKQTVWSALPTAQRGVTGSSGGGFRSLYRTVRHI
jgi:putative DNA primase/helicase